MKRIAALFLFVCLVLLWAGDRSGSTSTAPAVAGNVPDGMYMIIGEASRRCLEVGNNSCAAGFGVQIFDCDKTDVSNNQKFNVVSDGAGNYTISPVHSDLCLEIAGEKIADRTPVIQSECVAGKVSQKWSMSQYGDNLEIRDVGNNRCLDILRRGKENYAPINLQPCSNGANQRWRLKPAKINTEQGTICRASASHPEYECSGLNDQQKQINLGKTLTRVRCEDVCKINRMVSCRWAGSK